MLLCEEFHPSLSFCDKLRIKCCKRENLMNWNKITIMKNYLSDAIYKTMFYVNNICL